jgi:anti-sigma regulatory factor (Ser/Thr protein kinase)
MMFQNKTIMSTDNFRDSFTKREIRKMLIAVVLVIVVCAAYFLNLRSRIRTDADLRAHRILTQTGQAISSSMERVETIANAMHRFAEHALDNPDEMYTISSYMVESTMQVTSAGIAFIENYYPEKGRWFLAFAGYPSDSDTLITKQLGGENHDYLKMDWFQRGMESENGVWSNPYFDQDGVCGKMMTYAQAIHDNTGRKVGVVAVDFTLDSLAAIVQSVKLYPHSYSTLVSQSTGEVVVGPSDKDKIRGRYNTYTKNIEGKNLMLTLTITNADMYRRLHRATFAFFLLVLVVFISFFLIAHSSLKNLWQLGEERFKNQHIEDELAIARKIQMSLMPSQIKGEGLISQLDISGFLQPARFVGGDLYDYYVRDNKLIFCIGDISGKGVPAAMLMSISHSLFRTVSAHVEDPGRIVKALNDSVSDNNPDCMFLTLFLGVIDLDSKVLSYCNAGHNPPFWIHKGQIKFIDSEPDMILGIETGIAYTTHQLQMSTGDTLFLYTDGLSEAENMEKKLFGEQRILEIAAGFDKISAEEQIGIMQRAVQDFVGEAEQSDDLTMLAIRFQRCGDMLVLDNDIQELDKLEPFLNDFFERNKLDMSHLPQMDLALEEAIANVIMYAYPEGEKGTVEIFLEMKEGLLQTCISDSGTPFNPLQQPEAKLSNSIEERPIGGLGIHLIKEIMDEVGYQHKDGKNMLTMIRKI